MQPKKQLKVQYIGIFEEIDSFYWPKMHFLKEGQKIRAWVDHPPIIRAMPERKRFFTIAVFPKLFVWSCVKRVSKVSHFYLSDSKGHVCVVYSWLKAPSVPL